MKRLIFFLFLCTTAIRMAAQDGDEFIITIKTDHPGSSNSTSFTIPTTGTGYNYEVDWNDDGIYEQSGLTGDATWDYGAAGAYTIRIRGEFPRIYFENGGDHLKLTGIKQWGAIAWTSMEWAFFGCTHLAVYTATDAPDLSAVTSLRGMFADCTQFNGAIGNWDVGNVTDMASMFAGAEAFNQPIGDWDVSNVTDMFQMFYSATSFNQAIGDWDVSKVVNMESMFFRAGAFNQPIGTWILKSNVDLFGLFNRCGMDCINYSATLTGWAGNPLTPNDCFLGASGLQYGTNAVAARNSLLAKGWTIFSDAASNAACVVPRQGDEFIITIKTDNPGSYNSTSFTIPTTGTGYNYEVDWNDDGLYEQSGLTGDATRDYGTAGTYTIRIRGDFPRIYFNFGGDRLKLLSIDQWGGIVWSSMERAFMGCENMISNASDAPDLSAVTSLAFMFGLCRRFNGAIGDWEVGNVTDMSYMFFDARDFNQPIGNWDVSKVTNMSAMFGSTRAFNLPISNWKVGNVTNMSGMFSGARAFNQPLGDWEVSQVTDMSQMFNGATAFNQPLGDWEVGNVTNMSGMFLDAGAFNQPLGNWTLNSNVNLALILNDCGMDCINYSATLTGWAGNPATPNSRKLWANGLQYGTNAVAARNALLAKGWTINGDAASGAACLPCPILTAVNPGVSTLCIGEAFDVTVDHSPDPNSDIDLYFSTTPLTTAADVYTLGAADLLGSATPGLGATSTTISGVSIPASAGNGTIFLYARITAGGASPYSAGVCEPFFEGTVTVDVTPPTIACPTDITVRTNADGCTADVTAPAPTASDNCQSNSPDSGGDITFSNDFNHTSDASGNYPPGMTTVIWTATDAAGNTEQCSMTVTVLVPEISVEGNEAEITNGDNSPSAADDTDFGDQVANSTTDRTFIIRNTGTATLNLTGSPIVAVSGAVEFSVLTQPASSSIAPNGSLPFVLRYAPTSAGSHAATVSIANDDCDEHPYAFDVLGDVPCNIAVTNVEISHETCPGAKDGSLTVTAACGSCAGGQAGIRYSLDNSDFSNTTGLFTGLAPGAYTVYVQDVNDNSCIDSDGPHTVTAGVDIIAPVPDVSIGAEASYSFSLQPGHLPAYTAECSATPPVPTATDNCDGVINGVTTTTFPITIQGVTTVTWTFEDSHGNITTQEQDIVVMDTQAPIPDVFPGNGWTQAAKVLAADGATQDYFGHSVSISGNYAIVGAFLEDAGGADAGSAYIFVRLGSSWVQQTKLTATDGAAGDQFGYSVSISGAYAIVGAPGDNFDTGSAYIFFRSGGSWVQQAKLAAADGSGGDEFGFSVSISGDYALVGARFDDDNGNDSGSAYIFERTGGAWAQRAKLTAADGATGDEFGVSVAISGDYALVGAPFDDDNTRTNNSGSAYIFERTGGAWAQQAKLTAADGETEDAFGVSVAISGDYALVGAFRDRDDNGTASGSAYIFERTGGAWAQQTKLTATDGAAGDQFGFSVAISGDYALVGADFDDDNGNNSGSAYIFVHSNSGWTQQAKLTATDGAGGDWFGGSVAISGDYVLVGAGGDDDNGNIAGSAYFFELDSGDLPDFTAGCSATPPTPTATDNCAGTIDGVTTASFPITAQGTTTITWTYDDGNDNITTQEQDIILEDVVAPVAVCPTTPPTVALDGNGNGTLPVNALAGGNSTDNCSVSVTETSPLTNFTCADAPAATVVLTATDGAGKTSTANCTVQIDASNCCGIDITAVTATAETCSGANDGALAVTAACGACAGGNADIRYSIDNMDFSNTTGVFSGLASGVYMVYARDVNDNDCTDSDGPYAINAGVDNEPPMVTCPSNVTVNTNAGLCTASGVNLGAATASDNCAATVAVTNNAAEPFALGVTTATFTADDGNGNTNTCTMTVTVIDNEKPNAICQDITVHLDAAGNASVTAAQVNNGSYDNCGVESLSVSPNSFTCADVGARTVTLTATDANGNSGTCTAIITVEDNTLPDITCPASMTVSLPNGACETVVTYPAPTATDNCSGGSVNQTAGLGSGAAFPVGTTMESYIFTDAAGRTAGCSFTVTVQSQAPGEDDWQLAPNIRMWPPDNAYQTFSIADMVAGMVDGCGVPVSLDNIRIDQATSDEAEDDPGAYDGSTLDDIVISEDCRSVQLRKERMSNGNGRVYVITLAREEAGGSVSYADFEVSVPRWPWGWYSIAVQDGARYSIACSTGAEPDPQLPARLQHDDRAPAVMHLSAYPNPFRSELTIQFRLPDAGHASLRIFNLNGQLVRQLNDGFLDAGEHEWRWNGESENGQSLPSGVYFVQMNFEGEVLARRVALH